MTLAEQDQLGRELTDIQKRLAKVEGLIEKLTASRAIHLDSVGTAKPFQVTHVSDETWNVIYSPIGA